MKKRRFLNTLRNITLKALAWIAAAVFILSGMSLDSGSWLPFITCGASLVFLSLMAYANGLLMIGRWRR